LAEQSKDLKVADENEQFGRLPNWLLFLISALAIFFSPFGFYGIIIGVLPVIQNNLYAAVQTILLGVGFAPFVILALRRKYAAAILLLAFAIVSVVLFFFIYSFLVALAET
jgi:hypothetical protein